MSPLRYEALLKKVMRVRAYQVNYERVRTDDNKKAMNRVVNDLDRFLKDEQKRIDSKQMELV